MGQNKTKLKKKLKVEDQTNKPSLKISLSKSASQESSANNSTVSTTENYDNQQSPTSLRMRSSRKAKKEGSVSEKKLQAMFEHYIDENSDTIRVNGVMKFIEDLGLPAEDVVLLVIAWHLKAKEMGTFSKEEFTGGFRALGLDTIDKIRDRLDDFRAELKVQKTFTEIYNYAFQFYREPDKGRSIDVTTADSLIGLLLPEGRHIKQIRQFLKVQSEYKVINMDQWMSILEFSRVIDENFTNFEDDGAWPTLFDSFVVWSKQSVGSSEGCGRDRGDSCTNNTKASKSSDSDG